MIQEKYYIRRFTKLFSEKMDKYWFDIEKYIRLASKFDFDPNRLKILIENTEEDEDKRIVSTKTIGRILDYYNEEKEGCGDKSVSIDTVKSLGKALCNGDEYGLLIKIEPLNVLQIVKQADEIWGTSDINYIYRMLSNLIYELEVSSYYSYKPGTNEDGFEYYDMQLQSIRHEIDSRFWNNSNVRNRLYRLAEEMEILIKSFSMPGAPERWIAINPKLRYYDCVFDFKEENPELYRLIKSGGEGFNISFSFYPTEEECEARKEYFAELKAKNSSQNRQYSIDRLYQNELVEAFRLVFELDFEQL